MLNTKPRSPYEVVPEAHSDSDLRKHPRSTPQRPACRVAHAGRRQAEPDVAYQRALRGEPYLTGRFVESNGLYNLLINQAGRHIECLLALIVTGRKPKVDEERDERIRESVVRFGGNYDPEQDQFELYASFDPEDRVGILGTEGDGDDLLRLVFFEDVAPSGIGHVVNTTARRLDDRSVLFERYLGLSIVPSVFRTYHWFALTPQQRKLLDSELVFEFRDTFQTNLGARKTGIEGLVEHYFDADRQASSFARSMINKTNAEAIDAFFLKLQGAVFGPTPQEGGLHIAHLDSLVFAVRFKLGGRKMRSAPKAPEEPLVDLVSRIANDNPTMQAKALRVFGFDPRKPKNVFEAEFALDGADVDVVVGSGGAWVGTLTLTKTKGKVFRADGGGDDPNEQIFPLALATYGFGLGAGVMTHMAGTGRALSHHEWFAHHVPGRCRASGASAEAAVGVGGSLGLSSMLLDGDAAAGAPHVPLKIDFGLPKSIKDAMTFGLGASAGAKAMRGRVFAPGSSQPKLSDAADLFPEPGNAEYLVHLKALRKIHYCTNDAQLTGDAKVFIETMLALELPALESLHTVLEVKGYADREGKASDNDELSIARAANVRTHVLDALTRHTDKGRTKVEVRAVGRGEITRGPDHVKNPAFRRVEIRLGGKLLLLLEGVPDGLRASDSKEHE
jgi:outer membrane protein OmpA-like peptidoglycan-associated protein